MSFVEWLPSFVELSAPQVLNAESDMVRKEEKVDSCKVVIKAMESISWKRSVDYRTVLGYLVSVLMFPVYNMHLFGCMYENALLYEKCWVTSLSCLSEKWRGQFNSMSVETLMAPDCSNQRLPVRKLKFCMLNMVKTARRWSFWKNISATALLWIVSPRQSGHKAIQDEDV